MIRTAAPIRHEGHARPDDAQALNAFAARAAHSLGTGVGLAAGYAALLRESSAERLGAEGLAALDGLEGGLDRVRLFVEDLLELAVVEAAPVHRAPLRVDAAVAAAIDSLAEPIAEAGVGVEIGPLPDIVADAGLLERLFRHLLRGALAAIEPGSGRIAVSGTRHPGGARLEVTDNGPALAAVDVHSLFEPFALPRGSGRLAGAGVSMAICRRIAERHGGSTSAHSHRRGGCAVAVLLPGAA